MFDFDKIIGFDWDDGNQTKNHEKHNVVQIEAEQVFFNNPLIIIGDTKHSNAEPRYHAFGKSNSGRLLHIAFTIRENETKIRVISARDMHRTERKFYEKS